jgi:hypothetical protein
MADRYWRGGSGTWDATTTTNWSATSGGAGGASAPTSADNVIFNSASNATLYTVTIGTNAACADLTAAGPLTGAVTFSLGATAIISCYGSMTLPATGLTWTTTGGATLNFHATTTGKTITTNGVALGALSIQLVGTGGGWTLGSALTGAGAFFNIIAGDFNTGNFNLTVNTIASNLTATRSITLGSSTLTLAAQAPTSFVSTNLTFNAGTSQITCTNANPTFAGGGLTFYNVSFTSTAINFIQIGGVNTFNNLTFAARASAGNGIVVFPSNVTTTINGTLTLGSGTTGVARLTLIASGIAQPATLSVATLAAPTDVDFRDMVAAGASAPWSGTRLGNCLGNNNITFTTARTVYWVSAASASWSDAVWNTTSGNTGGATTNFPLAQDTIVIDNAGLTAGNTISLNLNYNVPNLDFSTRSNAANFATGGTFPSYYGDVTYSSAITPTGTGTISFINQSKAITFTSAGKTITQAISLTAPSGTFRINGDFTLGSTITFTLTQGTLDLTNNGAGNYTLSTGIFVSNNTSVRAITFGTGNITLTGNNAAIWNTNITTNFSYTGTPTVNATYSGSTGTRTITCNPNGTEAIAINFNISAGTDIVTTGSGTMQFKNLNFTGFTGTLSNRPLSIYGNLTFSSGMTCTAGASATTFAATSGTQQVTTNGNTTIDFPITQNGIGGTVQLQDNLTIGSTRTFTLTAGTLDLSSGNRTLSTGLFSSSNSNVRSIAFGTGSLDVTGNNTNIFAMGTFTNFSYTGTPTVNATYSGSVGTRQIGFGAGGGATEANVLTLNVSAGSDTLNIFTNFKSLNFTGFSGTLLNNGANIYGNLTFSSGMTLNAGVNPINFLATSGTQQITTVGKTLDFPLTFNGLGGTFAFQDALTMGGTRILILNAGNLLFKSGTTNTVGNIILAGNSAHTTRLGATNSDFQAFLQKIVGGTITASNMTIDNSSVTPTNTWFGDLTVVDNGNNTNWTFAQTDVRGHDAFLPQEIQKFKELDRKARLAEANRVRAAKLVSYHRKRRFTELLAPELINPQEESFYEQLREQQFPEEVAKEKAEQAEQEATADAKAKVEAKKREIKKELKRLQKEEKDAAAKVVELQRQKELLIDTVIARQKETEIQVQLAIIYKLQQDEMEDEAALLLLI